MEKIIKKANSMSEAQPISQNYEINNAIEELKKIRDRHKIWENPLLLAYRSKSIDLNDFKFLFSQY